MLGPDVRVCDKGDRVSIPKDPVSSSTLRLTGAVLLCGAVVLHAAQQAPRPEFRAGTDIVTLDVVVLDKDRKPVRGLTAADFVVTERREAQDIVSFGEVTIPPPDRTLASWTRDIGPDVVDNDVAGRRLVVMVLDDANGSRSYSENALALTRRTGHAIVDQLGPADLGAVVYTFLGRVENFTADKRRLHLAVDAYIPRNDSGNGGNGAGPPLGCTLRTPGIRNVNDGSGCQIDSLTRVAEVLRMAPAGRKMVAFISPGIRIPQPELSNPDAMTALPLLKKMFETLQAANATVYEIDPRGVTTQADLSTRASLSSATGGRQVQNTNAPERIVPAIFEENETYYLIGYRSTHTRSDGLYRGVSVKVNRPDVQVVTRSGYYGPAKASTRPSTKSLPKPVDAALAAGTFATDLRLGVNVAVFASAGREAEVAATIVVTDPMGVEVGAPQTHNVELLSVAYDSGWRSKVSHHQTIAVTRVPGIDDPAKYELTSRLSLKPGRYELRFAADSAGRTGSIYFALDVPNFAKEALALSGLLIEKAPEARMPTGVSLNDIVPIVPTSNRRFGRQDTPTAFMRIYQGGSKPLAPVAVRAEVRDTHDRVVSTETRLIAPADFNGARSADYRVSLPVARLTAGEYLLTVTASRDAGKQLERTVRFHVE